MTGGASVIKKLLNTLYVLSEDSYLRLDGENIVIQRGGETSARFPLHTLEGIHCYSYPGATPQLMGACAEHGIALHFYTPRGRYLASAVGENQGNVLLRRTQHQVSDNAIASCRIARHMIIGKVYNSRSVLERALRDHPQRVDQKKQKEASTALALLLPQIEQEVDLDSLRGLEGTAANLYFGVMDELILQSREIFYFNSRSRRPPLDPFNALLSFAYTLLARDCAAALTGVGLDPYVGFLHRLKPGRSSLALDLMEELRPLRADRFILTLINNRVIQAKHFHIKENETCLLDEEGRKVFLTAWQERKQETIMHPFLKENVSWGLLPHVQALLLARTLRGDYDAYPPFLWK